jgi:hypothetical protein
MSESKPSDDASLVFEVLSEAASFVRTGIYLYGVQVVGGSNPLAPTNRK